MSDKRTTRQLTEGQSGQQTSINYANAKIDVQKGQSCAQTSQNYAAANLASQQGQQGQDNSGKAK